MVRITFCTVIVLVSGLSLSISAAARATESPSSTERPIRQGDAPAVDHARPYSNPEAWRRTVPSKYRRRPEYAFVEADPKLPNVQLIGDSISMSYTVGVRKKLAGIANVYRAPDNCRSTRQTLDEIETYLGDVRWDVIHFNWGIHDLTHLNQEGKAAPPPEGKHQVPLDEYKRDVQTLVRRLKQTGARLIWASTTPIGSRTESRGYRRDVDVVAYNAAAAEVMQAEGVIVDDLYALVKPRAEKLLSDGVHFTANGATVLSKVVAGAIQKALEDPREKEAANASDSFSPLAREQLGASEEQLAKFEDGRKQGLIEVAPVHLPIDPPGDCNHYGWPVAAMVEDTIVVMHRRIPGHRRIGAGEAHEKMSYGVVLRSTDGGKTWSEPYDLRDCMKPEDRNRGGIVPLSHRYKFDGKNKSMEGYKIHLHAIGTTRDGAVVAMNNHGVFRSEDQGKTWKHFSKALREDTFPHQCVTLGPRILDHAQRGLLAFGNWSGWRRPGEGPKLTTKLVVLRSKDGGAQWEVEEHDVGFLQYEPAVLMHEDAFLTVTRDQSGRKRSHRQMTWLPDQEPTITKTNLQDPRFVDTVDLSFNPETKRLEIVRSERHRMELWLWSIAPDDWSKGEWRRECRLYGRQGKFYADADGFHPAGAVIDEKRGVQHIFIYTGHPNGPAGVFRLTRTLDTPKLADFLNSNP